LSKSKALTKVKGEPSIDIIQDKNIVVPVIENKGDIIDVDEIKERKKATKKAKKMMASTIPNIETNLITTKIERKTRMKKEVIPVFDALETNDKKWKSVKKFEEQQEPVESNVIIKKRGRKPRIFK